MNRWKALCCLAALTLAISACTPAPTDTRDADVKAIKDIETQWNAAWAAKDGDKILAVYADDAVLMAGGVPSMAGKDAIRAGIKPMIADPATSLKFQATHVEVAKSGDLGFTEGTYSLTVTDPMTHKPVQDHGSYVTVYRKGADGAWKAVSDIASSEAPPPAPAPEPAKGKKKK